MGLASRGGGEEGGRDTTVEEESEWDQEGADEEGVLARLVRWDGMAA